MDLQKLQAAIAAVAPIAGIRPQEIKPIDFLPGATPDQRAAAQAVFDGWVDPPDPDWTGFGSALEISADYLRIASHSVLATKLSGTLESRLIQQAEGRDRLANIKAVWDTLAAEAVPTADEIAALNAAIAANNIDQFFAIANDGTLTLA